MAIIKELGLEVRILVGKEPATEYPYPEPSLNGLVVGRRTKISHCYIEGQENVEFEIESKVLSGKNPSARWLKPKSHTMTFEPSFDGGRYQQNSILCDTEDFEIATDTGLYNHLDHSIQKFRFSAVSTVDSEDTQQIERDTKIAETLGLIRIFVLRSVRTPPSQQRRLLSDEGEEEEEEGSSTSRLDEKKLTLAESALKGKAISLGTTVSPPVEGPSEYNFIDAKNKDTYPAPYAVFCFKYRTRENLQHAMIIPRPRSPSPELVVAKGLEEAARTQLSRTSTPQPVVGDSPQSSASNTRQGSSSAQLVDHAVQNLSHKEALRLARERLEALPYEEILRLFGEGFKGLPMGRILRLAGEALANLPLKVVSRLAGDRLEEIKDQDKLAGNVKGEGEDASCVLQSPKPTAHIKREGEQSPLSGRPSKIIRTEVRRDTVDLTEDD